MFKKAFFTFCFTLCSCLALADMFAIKGIPVDVTAENATKAREQAMFEAQEKAFYQMLTRLTISSDLESLPVLTSKDILNLVQDISVSNEKTSSVRYIANVDVQFNPDAIQTFFEEYQVPYVTSIADKSVILPVYQSDRQAKPMLWTDRNPWLNVWAKEAGKSDLVPLILPFGDLEDIAIISEDKLNEEYDLDISPLLKRYQVKNALVLEATVLSDLHLVRVTIRPFNHEKGVLGTFSLTEPINAAMPTVLKNAAERTIQLLEQKWREKSAVRFDNPTSLTVVVPIHNLGEWIAIRNRLDEIKLIKQYVVKAVRRDQAQIEVFFAGNLAPFLETLKKEGLFMAPLKDKLWSLRDMNDVPQEERDALVIPATSAEMHQEDLPPVPQAPLTEEKITEEELNQVPTEVLDSSLIPPVHNTESAALNAPIKAMVPEHVMQIPSVTQPESVQMLEQMHQQQANQATGE